MNKSEIIAAELRAHRARKGETQRELAGAIGVNAATMCAWENRGGISLVDAWKLANHYGVSLDELAGRKTASN